MGREGANITQKELRGANLAWRGAHPAPAPAVEVGTGRAGPGGAVSTSAPPRARRLVELQGKN